MRIKIVNRSKHKLPEYTTQYSAGMDLCANLEYPVTLSPLERQLIGTGLFIELPEGYETQIRPWSRLAINKGINVLNTPGSVNADYRGEMRVILINFPMSLLSLTRMKEFAKWLFQRMKGLNGNLGMN
jgi:dUTP pyrophosphatase